MIRSFLFQVLQIPGLRFGPSFSRACKFQGRDLVRHFHGIAFDRACIFSRPINATSTALLSKYNVKHSLCALPLHINDIHTVFNKYATVLLETDISKNENNILTVIMAVKKIVQNTKFRTSSESAHLR